jgi:hypothetical protein
MKVGYNRKRVEEGVSYAVHYDGVDSDTRGCGGFPRIMLR